MIRKNKPRVPKHSWVLRGSIIRFRRKCGHPKCRCTEGELHETWALSFKVAGRTQMLMLRDGELPAFHAALDRYKEAHGKLEQRVQKTIATIRAQRPLRRQRQR